MKQRALIVGAALIATSCLISPKDYPVAPDGAERGDGATSNSGGHPNGGSGGTHGAGDASGNDQGGGGTDANGTAGDQGEGAAAGKPSGGTQAAEGGAGGMAGGLPTGIDVSVLKNDTALEAPGSGGTNFADDCASGQVLIGFNAHTVGGVGTGLYSVSGVCGSLSLEENGITTMQQDSLPYRAYEGSGAESALCPSNQVVVGFQGRETADDIVALSFQCAPLNLVGVGAGATLAIGSVTDSAVIGDEAGGTGSFAAITCEVGEVAVGQRIAAGGSIDRFGLSCAGIALAF